MPKQPKTTEARADLVMSIVFKMRSLAKDSPNETYGIRYPDGGCKSIYARLVGLLGERGKWDAVSRVGPFLAQHGLLLVEVDGSPQAVRIASPAKKKRMMPQEGVECQR
jgi:hypothetical protein